MKVRFNKFKRRAQIASFVLGALLVVCFIILFFNSESIELSQQDKIYLRQFLNDWQISVIPQEVHKSFESEFNFISAIQDRVLSNVTGQQVPHAFFGNVRYYYQSRQGICYDRAVLLEKFLLLYHFPFRHVYLYFGDKMNPSLSDFFKTNLKSHAALEVKTLKGWMSIGTNANWLGVGGSQKLLDFYDLRRELVATKGVPRLQKTPSIGTPFWKVPGYQYAIIYGVYSRHGDFFTEDTINGGRSLFTGQRHFLPDYNLRMLLYNFKR